MIDWIGRRNGRLVVISIAEKYTTGKKLLNVLCDCGKEKQINSSSLYGKRAVRSCGCLTVEANRTRRLGKTALNRHTDGNKVRLLAAKQIYKSCYADGNLSFDIFLNMTQNNCHYCNAPPSSKAHLGLKKRRFRKNTTKI